MKVILFITRDVALRQTFSMAVPKDIVCVFESTSADALRRMISLKTDLVFVDDAPTLGMEAASQVIEIYPDIPIICLTARSNAETVADLSILGVSGMLGKPFSVEALHQVLNNALMPAHHPAPSTIPMAASAREVSIAHNDNGSDKHRVALRWMSRGLAQLRDPLRIAESLADAVTDIWDCARAAVVLERGGAPRLVSRRGLQDSVAEQAPLSFHEGLMSAFEASPTLVDCGGLSPADPVARELQLLGGQIAAPLSVSGKVQGALILGVRATGAPYTADDRDLLVAIARCASISLENAGLYHDLLRQQRRQDAVLGHVNTGVVTIASDKTIAYMNQAAEDILQIRAVSVLGDSVQRLGSSFADIVLRSIATGDSLKRQEIVDGATKFRLGLSVTPLGDEGATVLFAPVPEQDEVSEDVAYSPFWEFLAERVAQEIKNPMVAITTFAQLLPQKYDQEEFRTSFAEIVQAEINRINSVVETLYDFAKQPRLVCQESELSTTVQSVLGSFSEELRSRSITVETDFQSGQDKSKFDPIYFSRALHNVVQNSIEAMPEGGTLRVALLKDSGHVSIDVSDTGSGIPPDDFDQIMLPFFSTKETGMGLGLTVANRIMKEHSGALELRPGESGGTTCRLTLPHEDKSHADHIGR